MIRLEALLSVVSFALLVYSLVDVIRSDEAVVRHLPRLARGVLVLLFPLVGSIAWLVAGRPQRRPARPSTLPDHPEYDRPGRMAATNPEADDAFLRLSR